jgi:hypothetical protein
VEAYLKSKGSGSSSDTQDVLALLAGHLEFHIIGHLFQDGQEALQGREDPGELRPHLGRLPHSPFMHLELTYLVYKPHIRHEASLAIRTDVLIIAGILCLVKMDLKSLRFGLQ